MIKKTAIFAVIVISACILIYRFGLLKNFNFLFSNIPSHESNLAAVLKVEQRAVREWQQRGGIKLALAYGSKGEQVELLQHALRSFSSSNVRPDVTGYFGQVTEEAVKHFQKEHGLPETGVIDQATKMTINALYFNELCPRQVGYVFQDMTYARVDKDHALPEGYTPYDLVSIGESVKSFGVACLRRDAADALIRMVNDAKTQGIDLALTSSFRREEIQHILYKFWLEYDYEDNIDKIAAPRHSEHQLGTAVDLTGKSIGYSGVNPKFLNTPEGKWLLENAHTYGFVQSYPDGKKQITGRDPEPWHFRWLGTDIATEIKKRGITEAEYFMLREN